MPPGAAGSPAPLIQNALYAILSKLSLVLVALAASTTATYSIVPPSAPRLSIAQIWATDPNLERVCSCESWGDPSKVPRQFNTDGSPLWGNDPKTGKPIKRDVGECQINTLAHADELARLHLDVVNSAADNVAYANILYQRNGLKDWAPSKQCWSPNI